MQFCNCMDTSVCATKFYRFKNIGTFTPTKIAYRPIFLVTGARIFTTFVYMKTSLNVAFRK